MGGQRVYDLGDLIRRRARIGVACKMHGTTMFSPVELAGVKPRHTPWRSLRFYCAWCRAEGTEGEVMIWVE